MKPQTFVLLFFCSWSYSSDIWTATYEVVTGIKLHHSYKIVILSRHLSSLCAVECLKEKSLCNSANYDGLSKCELNTYSPLDELSTIAEDPNWTVLYFKNDTWELVFRGTAGIGTKLYPYYTGNTLASPEPEIGCFFTHALTCSTHYKNDAVLNYWEAQNIKYVKVAMYKHNMTVVDFIFTNSINNSYTDWFNNDSLISSTYIDLPNPNLTFNYFSIKGDNDPERRFYINRNYHGCHVDYGWIAVFESGDCSYEIGLQKPFLHICQTIRQDCGEN